MINNSSFIFGTTQKLLIINDTINLSSIAVHQNIELIILSGNPNISLTQINQHIHCNQYVFDCSNPMWKIERWKKEAENLHLRYHSVPQMGAFVFNL